MLVLTRKLNEKIRVGDDIVVTIIQIDKGSVKIGFEAPENVAIYRDEVYEKIKNEGREAPGDTT
ncbi:MAG: carbon storage regulator CsrA [Thermodesulfobacteriota bacterium]